VWAVVQRAIASADLTIDSNTIASLHKGQRSVKGLASGFEHVVTHDLILSLRSRRHGENGDIKEPSSEEVEEAVTRIMGESDSPSHLYVSLLKVGLQRGWALGSIDLRAITRTLLNAGFETDPKTGRFTHAANAVGQTSLPV